MTLANVRQADTVADDPEYRARLRLVAACEEVRAAARALGLDPAAGELYAPWSLRADAWLWQSHILLHPECATDG